MGSISRRRFLAQTAAAAAGIELGLHALTPRVASAAPAESWPSVAVSQGTNADTPDKILRTALEALGGISRFVKPGQTVAIKPNATWDYPPHTASSTDPDLLRALILLVKEAGAKRIIIMDNATGIGVSASQVLEVSGIGQALEGLDVEKMFADPAMSARDTYITIDLPDGKAYQKLAVFKAAVEADVRINMAVAKSHVVLPVTLCLKHMMGFLASPPALHADLKQGIVDLNGKSPVQAQLHILEALRVRLKGMAAGYETDETNPRLVKRFNQVLAGTDPVLIDCYACLNYFGRGPKEIYDYILMAGKAGLGETDVKKATDEGRLRVFTAGQALASPSAQPPTGTPVATATATATHTNVPPTVTGTPLPSAQPPVGTDTPAPPTATVPAPSAQPPVGTNTPLPTPTPEPLLPTPLPAAAQGAQRIPDALNPNRVLSGALLPAAAIITGTGLVVGRRLRRSAEPPAEIEDPDGGPEADKDAEKSDGR